MKKLVLLGFCLGLVWAGAVFAQDRLIITFKDGRVQTIDTGSILTVIITGSQSFS